MPFEKGHKKFGGKKKGSVNRSSLAVKEKAELLGIDPISVLLFFAAGQWEKLGCQPEQLTLDHRLKAASELGKYIAPTLKSIEHSGTDGGPIQTEVIYDTVWRDTPDSDQAAPEALQADGSPAEGAPE